MSIKLTFERLNEFIRKARSQGQLRCFTKCASCGDLCDSFFILEDQEKCFYCATNQRSGKVGVNFYIVKNKIYEQIPFYCEVE